MTNPSGINPTEFKVLIKPDEVSEKKGSIIIPEQSKEREQHAQMTGTIIAMSPLAFTYSDDWPDDTRPKAGDRVMYAKFSGFEAIGFDGKHYKLVNDKDVTATLS